MDKLYKRIIALHQPMIETDTWVHFNRSVTHPRQGWKIHISSQIKDSLAIFERVSTILIEKKIHFKVSKDMKTLQQLNNPRNVTPTANKFITIYPTTKRESKELILQLVRHLESFQAPRILSDFQCGQYSPVHYRYGAYQSIARYDEASATIRYFMLNDKGEEIEDQRLAYPVLPDGMEDLFSEKEKRDYFQSFESVLRNNPLHQYTFEAILKKSNRGNVYRARHKLTDKTVIIKQCRPFVSDDETGQWSAMDDFKNEAINLKQLGHKPYTANFIEDFKAAGDYFLVQSFIDGDNFDDLSSALFLSKKFRPKLVDKLVFIVNDLHREGYYLLDLAPTNIRYTDAEHLYLLDLENIVRDKHTKCRAKTIFMVNPDVEESGNLAQRSYFSLALLSFALLTGHPIPFGKGDSVLQVTAIDKIKQVMMIAQRDKQITFQQLMWLFYILDMSQSCKDLRSVSSLQDFSTTTPNLPPQRTFSQSLLSNEARSVARYLFELPMTSDGRITKSNEFGDFVSPISFQHGLSGQIYFMTEFVENTEDWAHIRYLVEQSLTHSQQKHIYGDSLLFGDAGLLWTILYLYTRTKDRYYHTVSMSLARRLSKQVKTIVQVDFALGKAGIALSLLQYVLIFKDKEVEEVLHEQMQLLATHLLNQGNGSEELLEYSFAHGYCGIAYVLHLYHQTFQVTLYQNVVEDISKKVETILSHYTDPYSSQATGLSFPIGQEYVESFDIQPLRFMTNLNFSWCEGLAGILLYLSIVTPHQQELISIGQNSISTQHLKIVGGYCHGLASQLQVIYYQPQKEVQKRLTTVLFSRSYRNKDGLLLFMGDNPQEHLFDFGTGSLGIYWTLLNKPFPFALFYKGDFE